MHKWPAQVGTVVANVGRELSLLKMVIDMANADYLLFLYPRPTKLEGGILDSPCPSVRLSVRLSVDDMVSGA